MSIDGGKNKNSTENEQSYLKKITPKYRYLPISIFGVILLLIVLLFIFTANSSLPGDLAYPVDILEEKISLTFQFNDFKKLEKYYDIANERYVEYLRVDWEKKIYGHDSDHDLQFTKKETLNSIELANSEIDKYIKMNPNSSNDINKKIVLMKKKLLYIQGFITKNESQKQEQNSVIKKIKEKNGTTKSYFELID